MTNEGFDGKRKSTSKKGPIPTICKLQIETLKMKSFPVPLKRISNPFLEEVLYEVLSFLSPDYVDFILICRLVCKDWDNMIMKCLKLLWKNTEIYIPNLQKLPSRFTHFLTRIKCNPNITDEEF